MFGSLKNRIEIAAKSLDSLSNNLNKFREELPKSLMNSAIKEKAELISYMNLSSNDVDEILFSVKNSENYKKGDELYKQQTEALHLSLYKELYDMAKQQGLTVKELDKEVNDYFNNLK